MIRRLIKRVEQLPDSLKSITGEPKPARYAPKRCYLRWDQDHIGLDHALRQGFGGMGIAGNSFPEQQSPAAIRGWVRTRGFHMLGSRPA
jgi:hypothetical protein